MKPHGKFRKVSWWVSLHVTLILGLCQCGYQLLYTDRPFDKQRILLLPFAEETSSGLFIPLHAALQTQLESMGIALTSDPKTADAILRGKIQIANVPSTTLRQVQIYTVIANVHVTLQEPDGAPIWTHDVHLKDEFLPTPPLDNDQPLITESRRNAALLRLSQKVAEQIQQALLMDAQWQKQQTQGP